MKKYGIGISQKGYPIIGLIDRIEEDGMMMMSNVEAMTLDESVEIASALLSFAGVKQGRKTFEVFDPQGVPRVRCILLNQK